MKVGSKISSLGIFLLVSSLYLGLWSSAGVVFAQSSTINSPTGLHGDVSNTTIDYDHQVSPSHHRATRFVRVIGIADGVCSPRGTYNIYLRASRLKGLVCFDFDIPHARFTLDFEPGRKVTEAEIRRMVVQAGYTPGPIVIKELPLKYLKQPSPNGWHRQDKWCATLHRIWSN